MTSQGTNQQSSTAGESGLDTCDIRCSPVKRSTLELLQKPVNFVPTIRSHFRDNMQETYNSISDIADGEKFIPNAAQKELEVSDEEIRSRYLLDHPDNETLSYMEEHAALVKIKEAAVSRQIQGASESA
ncbi:uncharacterized protein FPOAC1_013796 [Fusarium poae]|uniref:uncharacterized protein n=1 Tax=Fusarium poae TaxID=36050 RepID=UPI001D03A1EB|nr:uncharacterized protein FPOAC1_013796 [Fusarium poae]KAG8664458.1 hypothetical protein FPOAC1_013796 [Fusarium poae]